MEQAARVLDQESSTCEIHKKENNKSNNNKVRYLNRTRIKIMGKRYTIDNRKLEIYRAIGDTLVGIGIIACVCILYCVAWLYQ